MVAHLVGADDLGVQKRGERVVDAVPPGEGSGGFDGVANLPLDGHGAGVEWGADGDGALCVTEFCRDGCLVDRHVGRPVRGPQVVAIGAEPLRGCIGLGDVGVGGCAVVVSGGGQRADEVQPAAALHLTHFEYNYLPESRGDHLSFFCVGEWSFLEPCSLRCGRVRGVPATSGQG